MEEKILIKTEKKPFSSTVGLAFAWAFPFFCIFFGIGLANEASFGECFAGAFLWALIMFVIILIILSIMRNCELTITDKRAYGNIGSKRVDLPIDSISSIGINGSYTLSISTSSGNLTFRAIQNAAEFHKVLSKLLIERQNEKKKTVEIKQEIQLSGADEIKKYKELLDSGIITQEEFDAKKKQLLEM